MTDPLPHPASFKDPAGFVFEKGGIWYRHLNPGYAEDYEKLMGSGLYAALTAKRLLIQHQELDENLSGGASFYKSLLPVQLSCITFPYEWSYSMLRDAALLTLDVCLEAIGYGMVLKDATAFNIQFLHAKPLFIDTSSFQRHEESKPWIAYRQFCESFLAPLLLSHYTGTDLNRLMLAYPEGIPVEICARLLPARSWFSLLSLLNIHLQAGVRQQGTGPGKGRFSKQKLVNLLQHLRNGLATLKPPKTGTTWNNYYDQTIKSQAYLEEKEKAFTAMLSTLKPGTALDVGANTGVFSRLMAARHWQVTASDFDAGAIETLYRALRSEKGSTIQPMVLDIIQPSPAIGWANEERASFLNRSSYDLVTALALVHHLALGRNIGFAQIAACFHALCKSYLIIEFVEREDEKSVILLQRKEIPYEWYTRMNFEAALSLHFTLITSVPLSAGLRTLYLWKRD